MASSALFVPQQELNRLFWLDLERFSFEQTRSDLNLQMQWARGSEAECWFWATTERNDEHSVTQQQLMQLPPPFHTHATHNHIVFHEKWFIHSFPFHSIPIPDAKKSKLKLHNILGREMLKWRECEPISPDISSTTSSPFTHQCRRAEWIAATDGSSQELNENWRWV